MSIQESQNQSKATETAAVEKRRRFIKGAGVVAPVVLTLSSPSVFGIQCGSEIISGNESQNAAGGSCQPGQNPAWWSEPGHASQWTSPYAYSNGAVVDPGTLCSGYTGGTTFDAAFGTPAASITGPDPRPMREILCSAAPVDALKRTLVAALLNGAIVPNTYPLNADDVKAIQAGILGVPTYPLEVPAIEPHVIAYFNDFTW